MQAIKQVVLSNNKRATYDYFIHEKIEAGMVLVGSEVRACFDGKMNLKNAYITIKNGEAFLIDCHIGEHHGGFYGTHEPLRERKLLLHRKQIAKLAGHVSEQGYTIIPMNAYRIKGKIKVEIAVAEGKKKYDKRHAIAKKDAERNIERAMKGQY